MIDEILSGREVAVGHLFLLNAAMWLTLGWLIKDRLCLLRRLRLPWRNDDFTLVAVALFVYMTGVMIDRGGAWWTLHAPAASARLGAVKIAALVGVPVAVVGGLCCMRVLSRRSWGHWVWITAGAIALLVPWLVHWLV